MATAAIAALTLAGGTLPAQAGSQNGKPIAQPALEARAKAVITEAGQSFKDLNANGTLDPYEDWRLPASERAANLVGQMTLAEKAGLMLIDTMNATCDPVTGARGAVPAAGAALLQNQNMRRFIFRSVVAKDSAAACSSPTPAETATFTNSVQELAEQSRLGIPALFKSNARNHIDPDVRVGINEASGAMTAFPKEAGLAAAALGEAALEEKAKGGKKSDGLGDMSVIESFAGVMGDEWKSVGLRGMYGYMADLSTEPRWYRTHETFTENADLNAEIMGSLVETLQGPVDRDGVSLSPESSVALTMKHFPGGGPQELGLDPHYSFGKTQVYPGGAFGEHLKPFQTAIDAGVSAIMPYYGVPMDVEYNGVQFEQLGMAFSKEIVNDLLRDQLGFKGYVNSDTGIINSRAWGLEEATVPQRVATAINGGTDTLSGFNNASVITDLVSQNLLTEERVTLAAQRLLEPLFQLGLFEDPYVDPAVASATVGSAENAAVAQDLQRKSLVLLQNEKSTEGSATLPLKEGAKVYLLGQFNADTVASYGYNVVNGNVPDASGNRPSAAGSDYVVVNVTARNANTSTYDSRVAAQTAPVNPIVAEGFVGLDGQSRFGATDACVAYGEASCSDNRLNFGGSLPWESSLLDFTGMASSQSWQVTPSLDVIKQATAEVGDPSKVVLHVYFRQPFVLDEASGLRDAGAIVAGFGIDDNALMDVLSGRFNPQGKMPFALAGTRAAIEEQYTDLPGYDETADGPLFDFGHGLSYAADLDVVASATPSSKGGKVHLSVSVSNNEEVPVEISVVTPFGTQKIVKLQPGASKSVTVNTRLRSIPAFEVELQISATIDGEKVSETQTVAVEAFTADRG
ncbi:MAG TPA: glycoside hydrolase family 3 N-terminal domain-containing protein [Microbacterium sp.]|nr:glycoside hydrolase family 3 N-terminal domain-containing protein [Microbacterium sp.]